MHCVSVSSVLCLSWKQKVFLCGDHVVEVMLCFTPLHYNTVSVCWDLKRTQGNNTQQLICKLIKYYR